MNYKNILQNVNVLVFGAAKVREMAVIAATLTEEMSFFYKKSCRLISSALLIEVLLFLRPNFFVCFSSPNKRNIMWQVSAKMEFHRQQELEHQDRHLRDRPPNRRWPDLLFALQRLSFQSRKKMADLLKQFPILMLTLFLCPYLQQQIKFLSFRLMQVFEYRLLFYQKRRMNLLFPDCSFLSCS